MPSSIAGAGSGTDIDSCEATGDGAHDTLTGGAAGLNSDVAHADPAVADLTPDHAVSSDLLVYGDLGAVLQSSDLGIAQTCACADIQVDVAVDITGDRNLAGSGTIDGAIGSGVDLDVIGLVDVEQADPALVGTAPLDAVGNGLFQDLDLGAIGQRGDLGSIDIGFHADIQGGVAVDNAYILDVAIIGGARSNGHGGLQIHISQVDPAFHAVVGDAAPDPGTGLGSFGILLQDGDDIALLQGADSCGVIVIVLQNCQGCGSDGAIQRGDSFGSSGTGGGTGGGLGHILQANPSVGTNAAPLDTGNGGLFIDFDLGAVGQGGNQSTVDTGGLADIQVDVAVDNAGPDAVSGAIGSGMRLLIQINIVHVDPALGVAILQAIPLDIAPLGSAVHYGLQNGDLGAGFQFGNLVGSGNLGLAADIDNLSIDDLTNHAVGRIGGAGNFLHFGVSQVDPAGLAAGDDLTPADIAGFGGLYLECVDIDGGALVQGADGGAALGSAFADGQGSCSNSCSGQNDGGVGIRLGQLANIDPARQRCLLALGVGAAAGTIDPLDAVNHFFLGDLESGVGFQSADGLFIDVDQIFALCVCLLVNITGRQGGSIDGVISSDFLIGLCKLGNQQLACGIVIQSGYGLAGDLAVDLAVKCVPAGESLAGSRSGFSQGDGRIGIVGDNLFGLVSLFIAIGIQDDVCIIAGSLVCVDAVQVHIGLGQAAVHQALEVLAGAVTAIVLADDVDELVATDALADCLTQRMAGVGEPCGAEVVAVHGQSVMLALLQIHIVIGGKLIDGLVNNFFQILLQQGSCILLADTIGICAGSNLAAVTNVGSSTGLAVLKFLKAFILLQDVDGLGAGCQIGSCTCGDRNHTDNHDHD